MLKKIIHKQIDDLIFAEYNPRQLSDEQYKHLKESISRFGLVDPIIINKNKDRKDIIIGGHQRVKVARTMGIDKVPCVEIDLTYDKEKELVGNEKEEVIEPEIEITEELFESHNYIMLYFDNELDWQTAKDVFELKTVKRKNQRIGDKGLGRVVKGKDILKKLL